ncbi:MAG: formate dehydrogenase accessory sulfurtransferase FdhD [Rhizobiales bacterium]|nr:formate dehydrogenase accessory sulfurtransferase FdhD [Hyphomicrobiales bacterium]
MTISLPSGLEPAPQGDGTEDTCSIAVTGSLAGQQVQWFLPEEVPVALHFNSVSYAVMMATPADLEDLAIGFALSEGLVAHASHVRNVLAFPSGDGFTADVSIVDEHFIRERMVSRSLEGRVGCGLCGIAEMADAIRMPGGKLPHQPLSADAVQRAFEALPEFQPMNTVNRTVHAAAWASEDGKILLAREDVGRHNALDKLIGAMARAGMSPAHGFALMSSRCSFELVQKCACVGISALATVSAPTALAYTLAKQAGLSLAALARQGVMIFDGDKNGSP